MFAFADVEEAESVLTKLAELPTGALVTKLPRQPGQKEARYAHLLSGEPSTEVAIESPGAAAPPTRVAQLEQDLQKLRSEFDDLKNRFEALEAQLR